MTPEERSRILAQARALDEARDSRGVAALLGAVDRAELLAEPELGFLHANALRHVGERTAARTLADELDDACARSGRALLRLRVLNLRAALHFDGGMLDAAAAGWSHVRDAAAAEDDDRLVANACNNLGVVHTLRGEPDEALASFGRALAAAQRIGERRAIAQAHQNLAIAFRELGFLNHAHAHFEHAIAAARADGSHDILGRAEEERALALLQEGDTAHAEAAARRALQRLEALDDRTGVGESLRVLGLVALARGRSAEARARLDQAALISRESGAALLEAEALEALAALDDRADAHADADLRRAEADHIFESMGASGWGRQVRARLHVLAAR